MRIYSLILLLFLLPAGAKAQKQNEIGVLLGTSYYLGDYNPTTHFYKPSPAGGVLFRMNFAEYYAIRGSGLFGWLKGEHNPNNFFLPGATPPFSKSFLEVEGVLEIGFLPYTSNAVRQRQFSPYAIAGVGAAMINTVFLPHIPMGIGIKYSPAYRWTIALEWRLHKTFTDTIDEYINMSEGSRSAIHNNDWFAYGGFLVSFQLNNKNDVCPAYR